MDARERLALVPEELPVALKALGRVAPEAAILSTCNRTELYAVAEDGEVTADRLVEFLLAYHRLAPREIEPFLYRHIGDEAVRHLFGVASELAG